MSFIRRNPVAYERWKSRLRAVLPMPEGAKSALSEALSTLHQKYVQDFVFIHINKCGGTSLERALGIPLLNHDTAQERRAKLGREAWERRFKFALVRNPYDRIASVFFYRHRFEGASTEELVGRFPRWLHDVADRNRAGTASRVYRPQAFWVQDDAGTDLLDATFQLERLERDIDRLAERLGRPLRVEHVKSNARRVDYRDLFDADTRQLVEDVYGVDFETFGYPRRAPTSAATKRGAVGDVAGSASGNAGASRRHS